MSPPELSGFTRVEDHDTLESTNERLAELARERAEPFTAVRARAQTRGRGRAGRSWHSPRDAGLWISVLLPAPPDGPPGVTSLAVGVAIARAAEAVAGVEVGLKWPNDLLVRRAPTAPDLGKVGGVLCETVRGPVRARIVAGIGVNLRRVAGGDPDRSSQGAAEALRDAAFLDEAAGRRIDSGALTSALARELRELADPPPDRLEGLLREEWDRRDVLKGHRVLTAMAPPGVAVGLDAEGALRVSAGGTIHCVRAGSVRVEGEGPGALYSGESEAQ